MKEFKQYVSDIDVGDILKTPSLAIFSFRAVLNISMLVTESERAKAIRSKILDIVIDVMAQKSGGGFIILNLNLLTMSLKICGRKIRPQILPK